MDSRSSGHNMVLNVAAAVVAAALVGGAPWWWPVVAGDGPSPTVAVPVAPSSDPSEGSATDTKAKVNPPVATTTREETAGCYVTIVHSLVTLNDKPETFSLEIRSVPPGDYPVRDWTITSFGGRIEQRWLEIAVEGDVGWIQDDSWTLDAKSPACDFG